jgi:Flp pilus assembly protein TadD
MAQTLILAALLAAQSAAPAVLVEARGDRVDVGYSELAAGQPQAAIERIQANRAVDANDPAALINLGAAHARMGDLADARTVLTAAIASPDRYELQLADGRWMDSRRAARMAMGMLQEGKTLAVR